MVWSGLVVKVDHVSIGDEIDIGISFLPAISHHIFNFLPAISSLSST
jgi:hypothetical protein